MKEHYETADEEEEFDLYREADTLIRRDGWTWQSVCAVLGLVGGALAPFLGAALDATSWLTQSQTTVSRLHVLSIVSCALTVPLLVFGGFCLDQLEKKFKRLR